MTALASRIADVAGARVVELTAVGSGSICAAHRAVLDDGRRVFAKTLDGAPEDFFPTESAGLHALRASGAVPVPRVLAADSELLLLEWIAPGPATATRAAQLGRGLAELHSRPADSWGAPGRPCYLGPIALDGPPEPLPRAAQWPAFHVEHRLLPLLRRAVDSGGIAADDAAAVERLCGRLDRCAGPAQAPALIHGDLWSGNVHWAAEGPARLIDPAAQGGHPETDLALLELFGCPQLATVLDAYAEVRPLPGRADRVPLHQLQHLLVHAALFGGGYGARSGSAARAAARC